MNDVLLKPCPFCGGRAKIMKTSSAKHLAICVNCGASRPEPAVTSIGAACAAWNIRAELQKTESLRDFARRHQLALDVGWRGLDSDPKLRFYARFVGVSMIDGAFEVGAIGNGPTGAAAIADFCKDISGKRLRVSRPSEGVIEDLIAPNLVWEGTEES